MKFARACVAGLAIALGLAACGGGTTSSGAAEPGQSGGSLEKTTLTVGVVPVPSSAPLFIAQKRGFFKEEGLTVKTEIIQAPQAVMPKIMNGSMDAFLTSYVSLLAINDSGAAKLKLFQHSQEAAPGMASVVVPKDSAVKTAADLKGKTVAVNVLKALGQTVTNAHLEQAGLAPTDVKYVAVPFADQLAALSSGKVDAAWLVEPFLTAAKTELGAVEVIDTMSGPTASIPVDGWGVSEAWLTKNPNTAKAFHRALARAQLIAGSDRNAVNEAIPTYTQIPAETAASMKLGVYSMEVDKAKLQKLGDLLAGYGYLKKKPDVTQQIAATLG
ncbi:ABC transporter substrate-binding protein [Nonomuraea muscovyensis]|uniref:NitT/TauT family transport system substrate-binding protein n=1 Tax=Nonomuraea muscovyensis TaxID=1124761 RepID=A0A7X0C7K4_9ACTN|nr:ABC transporter substrate-binding protein [Nonomuraea muscovyensis]MBB6349081.1 NitT/TauT family transport system substrate-binding protein [Nonomuraea muscovyensis]